MVRERSTWPGLWAWLLGPLMSGQAAMAVTPPDPAVRPLQARQAARSAGTAAELKPLLLAAVAQGQAQGQLGAAVVQGLGEVFGSRSPIEVTVLRLHWLEQTGCARLRVETTQAAVINAPASASAAAQTPGIARLAYRVSYCDSGRFPPAGPQLSAADGPDPVMPGTGAVPAVPGRGGPP